MEGLQRDNTIGVNAFIAINSRIVGNSEVIQLGYHRTAGITVPQRRNLKRPLTRYPRDVFAMDCAEELALEGRYTPTVTVVSVRVTGR